MILLLKKLILFQVGISLSIKKTKLLSEATKLLASRFVAYPATCKHVVIFILAGIQSRN